ncbi:hypothetical protein [Ligilactobacillus salivarius]|uniref:Uncharacterized protein n=1 Tax=Ligilactobacillus salivarius TaxID=1624 RepID=A0AAX3X851_9LACO|nr:hypothetical protein [Ligilactobacillus salivarius]WII29703.1 hypothetical protein QFE45_10570 [Ligilactobacillus salivarius]
MKIKEMSIKELIREVKRLDKELPHEVWEDAFEGFDSLIWNLRDAIDDWDSAMCDSEPYSNRHDYSYMVYKALDKEDYPKLANDGYEELYKGYIRDFFEEVLEKIEESMYDKELKKCTDKVMRLINFCLKRKGGITKDDRVHVTITDKVIMSIIKQGQKDNSIIYHFDRLSLFTLELSIFYKVKELINRDERLALTRVYDTNGKTCIEVRRVK